MKALSIREPYAILIRDGIKYIETRSFNTKYRGPIYIHACKTKVKIKDELKPLIKSDLIYGAIICKANLVDSIYMDEEFIKRVKKENYNNYISGYYEVGRYAWILKDIEVIDPIYVNGQLGLWNYDKK